MKTTFTLIIGIAASLSIWAASTYFASPYLLCEDADTMNQTTLTTKSRQVANTTHSSREKCTKVVHENGNENTTTENNQSISPNFLMLFFNFI